MLNDQDWAAATKPRLIQAINRDRKLSSMAARVAVALVGYRNQRTGLIYPSQELLADELGVSTRTIVRAVKALEARGWISKRRGRRRGVNRYSFNLHLIDVVEFDYEAMKSTRRPSDHSQPERVDGVETSMSLRRTPLSSRRNVTLVSEEPLEQTYPTNSDGFRSTVTPSRVRKISPGPMILRQKDGFQVVDGNGELRGVFRSEREAEKEISRIFPEGDVWKRATSERAS